MEQIEERLSEEIKKHEHLYNPSSPHYKDCQMANKSWREIAQNTGMEVTECLRRWKNLRDKYVRCRKKLASCSGDAGSKKVPVFYHFLSWLAPHIKHRETESNDETKTNQLEQTSSSSSDAGTASPSSDKSSLPQAPSVSPRPPTSPAQAHVSSQTPSVSESALSSLSQVGHKRKRDQDDWLVKQIAQLEERRLELQKKLVQDTDECSRFGQMVANMLRRVSEEQRPEVMHNVYRLLYESRQQSE